MSFPGKAGCLPRQIVRKVASGVADSHAERRLSTKFKPRIRSDEGEITPLGHIGGKRLSFPDNCMTKQKINRL